MAKNSKPCPVLNAVHIDGANSGAGKEICLTCLLTPHCIYERKDYVLTWKQMLDYTEWVIRMVKERNEK